MLERWLANNHERSDDSSMNVSVELDRMSDLLDRIQSGNIKPRTTVINEGGGHYTLETKYNA